MKKLATLLIIFSLLTWVFVGCSHQDEANHHDASNQNQVTDSNNTADEVELAYQPEEINPDIDVCEICGMAIADDRHATQIMLKNKRSIKFDDLGCLFAWIEENGKDDVGAAFVRDYHTQEWILLEDATYVFDEQIETPMAYGVISFASQEEAEQFVEEHGFGTLLTAADLHDHKWEMMDHDHDHAHGHDHEDEHDHGVHDHHDAKLVEHDDHN